MRQTPLFLYHKLGELNLVKESSIATPNLSESPARERGAPIRCARMKRISNLKFASSASLLDSQARILLCLHLSRIDVSEPATFHRCLDSLARFYNSQITVRVGYLVSSFVALIAVFALTKEWLASLVAYAAETVLTIPLSQISTIWIETLVLGIDACFFLVYIFGKFHFCFRYLLGRMQYYQALSEIVWDHMGITPSTRSMYHVELLRQRAVGEKGIGINEAILSLFEARLSVSIWHRKHSNLRLNASENKDLRTELQQTLRSIEPFAVTHDDICWVGHTYYAQPAPLFGRWNKADLLLLAHRDALRGYRQHVRRYVESLGEAQS